MALLTVDRLKLGYGSRTVVENISFQVESGDYLCIVGENGSGKTTLMKTLLGLQESLGGEIRMGDGLQKNEIGYLPQQTEVQKDFPASVEEVVLSGCQSRCGVRPFYNHMEKDLARDNMERMGITSLRKRCYRELSGGQQQRVLLARALCAAQRILLLDEPVSGLDPGASAQMYRIIENLNRDGITIIMISHDIQAALQYADHILQIGSETFFGARDDYLRSRTSGSLQEDKVLQGQGARTRKAEIFPSGTAANKSADRGPSVRKGGRQ